MCIVPPMFVLSLVGRAPMEGNEDPTGERPSPQKRCKRHAQNGKRETIAVRSRFSRPVAMGEGRSRATKTHTREHRRDAMPQGIVSAKEGGEFPSMRFRRSFPVALNRPPLTLHRDRHRRPRTWGHLDVAHRSWPRAAEKSQAHTLICGWTASRQCGRMPTNAYLNKRETHDDKNSDEPRGIDFCIHSLRSR